MFLVLTLVLTVIFLAGTFFLTAINSAFRRIHKKEIKLQLNALGKRFFYQNIHRFFFPQHEHEGLFFATICAQNITRFCYIAFMLAFLSHTEMFYHVIYAPNDTMYYYWDGLWLFLSVLAFILGSFFFGDYLPRVLGSRFPETTLRICAPFASPFMLFVFPITYLFLKISHSFWRTAYFDFFHEPKGKQEIIDMLQQTELAGGFDMHEKKLIESVVTFKDRIAREVMVPRVDMFSLPADISIREAARLLENEGYSRTPIYRNTVDNIVGVLMYKDVLSRYMEYEQTGDHSLLDAPIETIQKNVLHAPETKKISSLLQEFRKKQLHLAIVVDEYGGTEGIVTIEDILEQIVGEIADEYDQEEEVLFYRHPDGSWIVDARMNILDVEEELGINIPQEGEYDTIGGYIFHTTGTIPTKGFVIHHDDFDMNILESNDRCVEKVRIKPLLPRKIINE